MKLENLIFIDTEFTSFENQDLISVGFYNHNTDNQLYLEIIDYPKKNCSDFVKNNIIPYLDLSIWGINSDEAKHKIIEFFYQHQNFYFVADHGVDFHVIKEFLKPFPIKFKEVLIHNIDIDLIHFDSYLAEIQNEKSFRVHHAMDDAMANFFAFEKCLFSKIVR